MASGRLCSAILDTGSGATIISKRAVKKLGLSVDQSKALPSLVSVNGVPLKLLGMTKVSIHVGEKEVHTVWVSVVPDAYINRDILLGWDVIQRANLEWDARRKVMIWRNLAYDVAHIRNSCKSIRTIKVKSDDPKLNLIQLKTKQRLEPFQSKILHVKVSATPDSQLIVWPRANFSSQTMALLVTVNEQNTVPIILSNPSRMPRSLKAGSIIAHFEPYSEPVETFSSQVLHTTITNDLIPSSPKVKPGESCQQQLERLIESQEWSYLNPDQKTRLKQLVLNHKELFVLGNKDLGTMIGDPAHINVKNPVPCRTPQYRYPENAKVIISEMLSEMQEKGIIEPSSAAWLSPIVLVNKPNGSKRMCLDFRRVNEHLAADIHPLPRLEDLVNIVSGHKFMPLLI